MKKWILKLVPWALFALFATEIVAIVVPKPDKDFRVQDFGRLPVLLNGRVQPFDSVGRNALLQIRGTASVPLQEKEFLRILETSAKAQSHRVADGSDDEAGSQPTRGPFSSFITRTWWTISNCAAKAPKSGLFIFHSMI